jgi:nucleoside-diphosphate-sugar epimerase
MDDLRPGRLFVFGLGYSMTRLARRLRDLGWQVAGTTRDPDRLAQLQAEGFDAHAFGPDQPLDPAMLAGSTHLVQSISPEDSGDPAVPALTETLRALPELRWVGYLSTPAVYGDRAGAWIDETADPAPGSPRGWKRLEAERAWFAAFQDTGVPVQVFRLAGIYGPGRSAFDQLRRGRARRIDKPGQVFNRIHVDDIGSILLASMRRPRAGAIYNVADGHPSSPNDPIEYACRLLGIDPPPLVPFEDAGLSPLGREFYAECKRLTVDRIKGELGVTLAYPSYCDGLDAILAVEQA